MIHYHGTPLTPNAQLYKMGGKHFCVSFARPDQIKICLAIGQSVMLDNGAFSSFTLGKRFNKKKYYEWLDPLLGHPHWAVIPDIIGGSEQENKNTLEDWPFQKDLGSPVWHINLSFDYLSFLIDNYSKVCFGSSGEYWQIGSEKWNRRIDDAFNYLLSKNKQMPWIHMLRGLSVGGERWPFASADSTNVARNFKTLNCDPEKMARKIDSFNCPIHWEKDESEQMELI